MNENQNEIQNENQEQSQETHKHFLTLHISHKGQQKTLHFRIRHAVAVCAATVFLVGGSVCAVGAYQKTKTDLHTSKEQLLETERERRKLEQRAELLETENTEYTENIDALQNKTTELEQKINEIESVKEDLYHQITNLDESDSSASLDLTAMTSALAPTEGTEAAAPTFTTLVSTSYNKASALSTHLDKMSLLMDETSISFSAVADTVTYLAALSNAPSGWPVDSRTVSTEFNPSADPSISDGRKHYGMDISTQSRIIPIYATASGTVVTAQYHSQFGNYVVIDHGNGFTTLYAHCTDLNVAVGDKVKKGDTIATTGSTGMSTGVHCHYEIQLNGVYQNPRDYLGEDKNRKNLRLSEKSGSLFICLIVCTISVSADGNDIPQQSGLSFQCRIAEILRSCKHFSCLAVALPSVAHICRRNAIGIQT